MRVGLYEYLLVSLRTYVSYEYFVPRTEGYHPLKCVSAAFERTNYELGETIVQKLIVSREDPNEPENERRILLATFFRAKNKTLRG